MAHGSVLAVVNSLGVSFNMEVGDVIVCCCNVAVWCVVECRSQAQGRGSKLRAEEGAAGGPNTRKDSCFALAFGVLSCHWREKGRNGIWDMGYGQVPSMTMTEDLPMKECCGRPSLEPCWQS